MYSEFGKFSFLCMSNSQLFMPGKDSKPIKIEFLSRPTSEFPDGCEIPAPELDKDKQQQEMEHTQGENSHLPMPSSSFSSSCSSSSSSSEHGIMKVDVVVESKVKGEDEEVKEGEAASGFDDDDDDGYHTPTSPRHRIPATLKCPPAPRKPSPRLCLKRKALRGHVRQFVKFGGKIELVVCEELDDLFQRLTKKARGDAVAAGE